MTDLGDRLFTMVTEYAALGDHRAGTPTDGDTVGWFSAALERAGATVQLQEFAFDRYDCRWEVTLDGEAVASIPLFYEGTGRVSTTRAHAMSLPVAGGAALPGFAAVAESLLADGAHAAVVATDVPGGRLCAVNRDPSAPHSGLPTVCVAGALGPALEDAQVRVDLDARIVPGRSTNVVAHLGEGADEDRVILTTPLSGWFRCAGERGTGIAVCLAVASELAERGPVTILGSNAHELAGLGVRHHLRAAEVIGKAIFHFGASIAAGDSDGVRPPSTRSRQLFPAASVGDARSADIARILGRLGSTVRVLDDVAAGDPDSWVGEAREWAMLRRPMVSIAGGFPLFHSPEDVPGLATTPALLVESLEVALEAAEILQGMSATGDRAATSEPGPCEDGD